MKSLKIFKYNIILSMEKQLDPSDKESILKLIKQAIEMLCEKNISEVVILSSYKINSVLKENYGVDIRVDKIGRILSNLAKRNQLKRLSTNIPKYKLHISKISSLEF
ncbi:MAG: hypothetical protein ACFFD5_06170 [Candidatus Thorarchaeota archaeon]